MWMETTDLDITGGMKQAFFRCARRLPLTMAHCSADYRRLVPIMITCCESDPDNNAILRAFVGTALTYMYAVSAGRSTRSQDRAVMSDYNSVYARELPLLTARVPVAWPPFFSWSPASVRPSALGRAAGRPIQLCRQDHGHSIRGQSDRTILRQARRLLSADLDIRLR